MIEGDSGKRRQKKGLSRFHKEPPTIWLHTARGYKRENSSNQSRNWITGYDKHTGLHGNEAEALEIAVKQVNPQITVNRNADRDEKFVNLSIDDAARVEKLLVSWGYRPGI